MRFWVPLVAALALLLRPKRAAAALPPAPPPAKASDHEKQLAAKTGLTIATLRAIQRVEGGTRSATALRFEPHKFHQYTNNRLRAVVPFTPSSGGFSRVAAETNQAAMERAFTYSPAEAVRAASWGRFQVMGDFLLGLFGGKVGDAAAAFWQHPDVVSDDLLVAWLQANPQALAAAKAQDWPTFARIYNGPSFAKNGYDTNLAAAHADAQAGLVSVGDGAYA
jgi:hypothetical protein